MKDWKTTLIGFLVGGGYSIYALIEKGFNGAWTEALFGLGIAFLGYLSSDKSKPKLQGRSMQEIVPPDQATGG